MEIVLNQKQCSRIRTSEDLSDIYAYFERDYEQEENESDEAYLDRLPSYCFDTTEKEQERLNDLMGCIGYVGGVFNKKNVKRILGASYGL